MTDYHTLPCGTKIPPEGIKCRVWDDRKSDRIRRVLAFASGERLPVICAAAQWRNYEIIKEPKQVPLSYETYHGEPLRRYGGNKALLPNKWDSEGVGIDEQYHRLNSGHITWDCLMSLYERFKDGKWQPCSVTEEQ